MMVIPNDQRPLADVVTDLEPAHGSIEVEHGGLR